MARAWKTKRLVVVLTIYATFLSASSTASNQMGNTCGVTQEYLMRHGILGSSQVRSNAPPQSSITDRVCLSKVASCCSESTEAQIYSKANADLAAHFKMVIEPQRDFIHLFMHSFKQRALKAVNESYEMTVEIFTQSYGLVYKRNQEPLTDYFRALYTFVDESTERVVAPTLSLEQIFFNLRDVLRRTMLGIYGDYSKAANNYVSCMLELIRTQSQSRVTSGPLDPQSALSDWFGYESETLEKLTVRTLIAVRTILASLERLRTILTDLAKNVPMSESCKRAFAGLRHCAPCAQSFAEPPISGSLASLGVCPTSCLAFREACFNISRDFLDSWNSTFDTLTRVYQHYESSWSVQSLVEQMPVIMSEMVMNFQRSLLQEAREAPYSSCLTGATTSLSSSSSLVGRQKRAAPNMEDSATTQTSFNIKRKRKLKPSVDSLNTTVTNASTTSTTTQPTTTSTSTSTTTTTSTTVVATSTLTSTSTLLPVVTKSNKGRRKQTRDFVIGMDNMPTLAPATVATSAPSRTTATTTAKSTTPVRTSARRLSDRPTTVSAEGGQNLVNGMVGKGKGQTLFGLRSTSKGQTRYGTRSTTQVSTSTLSSANMTNDVIVYQLTRTRQLWPRLTDICNLESMFVQVSFVQTDNTPNTNEAGVATSLGDSCWNGTLHVTLDPDANIGALARAFANDFGISRPFDSSTRDRFRQMRVQLNQIANELAGSQRREPGSSSSVMEPSSEDGPSRTDLDIIEESPAGKKRPKANKKPPASSLPTDALPDGSGTSDGNDGSSDVARPADDEVVDGSGTQPKRCPNPDDEDCNSKQNENPDDFVEGSADPDRYDGSASPDASDNNFEDSENARQVAPTAPRIPQTTPVVLVPRANGRGPSGNSLTGRGAVAAPVSRAALFLGCTAFVRLLSRVMASA